MSLFKRLVILGIGTYIGIYVDQNYEVPRVDDPSKLMEKLNDWVEQYKRDKPKGD